VSTFFAAAYLGLGLPAVLTGVISQLIGTVDASAYSSGLVAAIVVAAILVVLRTFGTAPSPKPGCTPSDGWCSPQEPVTEGAGQPNQSGPPGHCPATKLAHDERKSDMTSELQGKTIAILAADGVEQVELERPG
jgi:hypothetical protein